MWTWKKTGILVARWVLCSRQSQVPDSVCTTSPRWLTAPCPSITDRNAGVLTLNVGSSFSFQFLPFLPQVFRSCDAKRCKFSLTRNSSSCSWRPASFLTQFPLCFQYWSVLWHLFCLRTIQWFQLSLGECVHFTSCFVLPLSSQIFILKVGFLSAA